MSLTITHTKTNTIPDWDQQKLDAAISAGLYPPGTRLADIVLPSDWNHSHDITDFAGGIADTTHAATSKATPVDADEIPLVDSGASNALKKLTWANLKATLKTYFDTLYGSQIYTFASGYYYTIISAPQDATQAMTQNTLIGTYFPVSATTTFDRIGIEITTAIASSTVRLGIFKCAGGIPSTRVLDAGTVDSSTTGAKAITISQSLSPGLYVLLAVSQGGASGATVRSRIGAYGISPPQTSIANQNNQGFTVSGVSGALASSYTWTISQTFQPKVYLRAA